MFFFLCLILYLQHIFPSGADMSPTAITVALWLQLRQFTKGHSKVQLAVRKKSPSTTIIKSSNLTQETEGGSGLKNS